MNRVQFLNAVEKTSSTYSDQQLLTFIHEIGKIVPDDKRELFLEKLKSIPADASKEYFTLIDDEAFQERFSEIVASLKQIENGDLYIEAFLDSGMNCNDLSENHYFMDNGGIEGILDEANDFIHSCMDQERYIQGYEVGDLFLHLRIQCIHEDGDEEFSISNMISYDLVHIDMTKTILDILCCAYHALPLDTVSETLFDIIKNHNDKELYIRDIIIFEEGLDDFDKFLPRWLEYLGSQTGNHAERLIYEAIDYMQDREAVKAYAEKHIALHPGICLKFLQDNMQNDAQILDFGDRCLSLISPDYVIRSDIALTLLSFLARNDRDAGEKIEHYGLIAFESDTRPINYLKALLRARDKVAMRGKLHAILERFEEKYTPDISLDGYDMAQFIYNSELRENMASFNNIYVLRFLDGQFMEILESGKNEEETLGGPGAFLKQSLALFLLALFRGEELDCGMQNILFKAQYALNFSKTEYERELPEKSDAEEEEIFYAVFREWKACTPMDESIQAEAVNMIRMLLFQRAHTIMADGELEVYDEFVSFIAAYGEVLESRGLVGGKQALMTELQNLYPKRMIFRTKLKEFGWIEE